tara:strand:+ start:1350 stop:1583 length:234 start_codon:yes stop_codon:yes gene_type:complete
MKRGRKKGDINPNSPFQQIKRRLERGWTIDNFKAFELFNITRLSGIIHTLRNTYSMNIETNEVTENGKRFARYKLAR